MVAVSQDTVRVMINDRLERYDREVSQPRHEQNLAKFDKLFATLNQIKGGVWLLGSMGVIVEVLRLLKDWKVL